MGGIEDILGVMLLLIFCYLISRWEKRRDGTIITPFGVLAWPYAIVVTLINLIGKNFGFFPVNIKSIIFVMVCLVFFFIGGMGSAAFFGAEKKKTEPIINNYNRRERLFDLYRPLFIALAASLAVRAAPFPGSWPNSLGKVLSGLVPRNLAPARMASDAVAIFR